MHPLLLSIFSSPRIFQGGLERYPLGRFWRWLVGVAGYLQADWASKLLGLALGFYMVEFKASKNRGGCVFDDESSNMLLLSISGIQCTCIQFHFEQTTLSNQPNSSDSCVRL